MKKNILLLTMGLLLINGCASKSVESKPITTKSVTTKMDKITKKTAISKKISPPQNIKEEKEIKQWGAPTITEAEAMKLFGVKTF